MEGWSPEAASLLPGTAHVIQGGTDTQIPSLTPQAHITPGLQAMKFPTVFPAGINLNFHLFNPHLSYSLPCKRHTLLISCARIQTHQEVRQSRGSGRGR